MNRITEFDVDSIKFDDEEPDSDEMVVVAHASSALVRLLQWNSESLPNLKLAGARGGEHPIALIADRVGGCGQGEMCIRRSARAYST